MSAASNNKKSPTRDRYGRFHKKGTPVKPYSPPRRGKGGKFVKDWGKEYEKQGKKSAKIVDRPVGPVQTPDAKNPLRRLVRFTGSVPETSLLVKILENLHSAGFHETTRVVAYALHKKSGLHKDVKLTYGDSPLEAAEQIPFEIQRIEDENEYDLSKALWFEISTILPG